jgi:hypothetical protein
MICTEAAEFVSALCDGEIIPPTAAKHIGTCPVCQVRLTDYLAMGVELRRTASLEQSAPGAARTLNQSWTRPLNPLAALLQKGWGTMRIPRLAFAALLASIVALASTLAVVKVGAKSNGTVVLLTATGPSGRLMDCPLSTLDKNQATCSMFDKAGQVLLGFKVSLHSREGARVLLDIRTRTYPLTPGSHTFGAFELDNDPAKEIWLQPGEPAKFDVPDVGTLTLTGEWLDHIPILVGMRKQDVSPDEGEIRFASPLLLKDKKLVGDGVGWTGGIFSTDNQDWASAIYLPGEGRFLIAQVPMKGAVEAHVATSRLSFEEGGHTWEIANGVPITRADHLWILHQPQFKPAGEAQSGGATFGNQKLMQTAPGEWEPAAFSSN